MIYEYCATPHKIKGRFLAPNVRFIHYLHFVHFLFTCCIQHIPVLLGHLVIPSDGVDAAPTTLKDFMNNKGS